MSSGAVGTAGADWCTKLAAARSAPLLLLPLFAWRWCLRPAAACAMLPRGQGPHTCGLTQLLLDRGNAWHPAAAAAGVRAAEKKGSNLLFVDAAVVGGVLLRCWCLLPEPRQLLRGATDGTGCVVVLLQRLCCSRDPAWWPGIACILLLAAHSMSKPGIAVPVREGVQMGCVEAGRSHTELGTEETQMENTVVKQRAGLSCALAADLDNVLCR